MKNMEHLELRKIDIVQKHGDIKWALNSHNMPTMRTKTMHPTMYKCKTQLVGSYFCKRNNPLMYIIQPEQW